jgi:hypothetical protein
VRRALEVAREGRGRKRRGRDGGGVILKALWQGRQWRGRVVRRGHAVVGSGGGPRLDRQAACTGGGRGGRRVLLAPKQGSGSLMCGALARVKGGGG